MTVTSHACDITVTKVPAASAVCDGASVTYTYTVTNNSDEFTLDRQPHRRHPGPDRHGPRDLAPGATETFTADGAITGTVTNTVTADGVLDDPDATAVSESVDATVTGEDCTITVTKTAASSDVCDGASVTYSYTVTNNSDSFDWTGTLTDSVLGEVVAGRSPSAPARPRTYTLTGSSRARSPTPPPPRAPSAIPTPPSAVVTTDPVTVTSHACDITVTKVPAASAVCDGATVTYTYTVTNNSDEFTWTGSLTDDILGPIGTGPVTIAPGATETFTADGAITGTVTNTVTADGVPRRPRRHRGQRERRRHGHRRGLLHHGDQDRRVERRVRRRSRVDLHLTVINASDTFTLDRHAHR